MPLKTGSTVASLHGNCMPPWYIMANSPSVFIATVLPPVFGPVMTNPRWSASIRNVIGTASSPSNGCRASTSDMRWPAPASPDCGVMATDFVARAYRARAIATSIEAAACIETNASSPERPIAVVSVFSTLASSRCAASSASCHALPAFTAAVGSINTVCPVPDTPWITPGMEDLNDALTSNTMRPLREAMTSERNASLVACCCENRSS